MWLREKPGVPLPGHRLPWELMETGGFLFRHENRHDVDIRGQDGSWNHKATWTDPPWTREERGNHCRWGDTCTPTCRVREQR